MAKKKDEKDVLVVRDEKTGEISVVAGLNADGSPKRIPAKAENAQSFLQFDRHGDVLDNFFRNFFRQCREPSRFGFYRVAADQADKLLEVIKDLLKDPDGNKEMLAPHKVDTSGYEKKVQEEQSAEKQEQPEQKQDDEPKKQEEMEQKNEQNQESPQQTQGNRGYQPIDESKINWQKLEEKWGVKRDDLEKSGDLNRMLNYGKSDLVRVSPNFGGEAFELDARLSFKKDGEGNVSLVPHFIRKEQKLDDYKEHKFSDDDRKNLRETGNLGRVVDLVDRETGEIIPSFVRLIMKSIHKQNKREVKHIGCKRFGIQYLLKGIYTHNGLLYFHTEIKNQSNVPFDVDYITWKIVDKKVAKRTAMQEQIILPLRAQNYATLVPGKKSERTVFTMAKFTIPDDKCLVVELNEKNGGRHQSFVIENEDLVRAGTINELQVR